MLFVTCLVFILEKMAKRKSKSKKSGKLVVKRKFYEAIKKLHRLKANQQRAAVSGASNEFVNDISKLLRRLKTSTNLISSKHRRGIKKQRLKFKRLAQAKSTVKAKRRILTQKGGFLPFLIPLIGSVISGLARR